MTQEENSLHRIQRLISYLNPALKRVGEYVLSNPDKIKTLRISELATACKVSEATVTRFVKEIGLENFQNFKISVAEILPKNTKIATSEKKLVYDDVNKEDTIEKIIEKILFRNTEAIQNTLRVINIDEIERAIVAIDKAAFIVLYCVGASTIAAESAKMRFYRIGKQCIVYNDPAHLAVSSSTLGKNNIAIGISNSGHTLFTVNAMKNAKKNGVTTICITSREKSPITKFAEIKLFTATKDSSFFQESFTARSAQMIVIDILYACYASRHYNRSIKLLENSASAIKKALY